VKRARELRVEYMLPKSWGVVVQKPVPPHGEPPLSGETSSVGGSHNELRGGACLLSSAAGGIGARLVGQPRCTRKAGRTLKEVAGLLDGNTADGSGPLRPSHG